MPGSAYVPREKKNAVGHHLVDWALEAVDKGLSHEGDEHDLAAAVEAAQELGRPEFTELALGVARAWEMSAVMGIGPMPKCCTKAAAVASKEPKIAIRSADPAWSRSHGTRAVALFGLATDLAVAAGDPAAEAYATSGRVELMGRFGCYADIQCEPEATRPLVERSWSAAEAAGDPCSRARALLAWTWRSDWEARDVERMGLDAEQSLLAARECGDMAILSSALDGWCSVALKRLDMPTAQAAVSERLEITERFDPHQARQFLERFDAVHMSCMLDCILGRFEDALRCGQSDRRARPWTRHYLRRGNPIAPALFFLGKFDQSLEQVSGAFAEALQRPGTGNSMLLRALCCAAAICGYRGDHEAAAEWLAPSGSGGHRPARPRLLHQNDAGRRAPAPRPAPGSGRTDGRATFGLGVAVAGLVPGRCGPKPLARLPLLTPRRWPRGAFTQRPCWPGRGATS